jgi:hypothetical protein
MYQYWRVICITTLRDTGETTIRLVDSEAKTLNSAAIDAAHYNGLAKRTNSEKYGYVYAVIPDSEAHLFMKGKG